jgi:hypothetical protein
MINRNRKGSDMNIRYLTFFIVLLSRASKEDRHRSIGLAIFNCFVVIRGVFWYFYVIGYRPYLIWLIEDVFSSLKGVYRSIIFHIESYRCLISFQLFGRGIRWDRVCYSKIVWIIIEAAKGLHFLW